MGITGLEEHLGVIECKSGNVEVQWNDIKKRVLNTVSDLVGKVEWTAKKPWIRQKTMDVRKKLKHVDNEGGRKNYRRLRNDLKGATEKSKKE